MRARLEHRVRADHRARADVGMTPDRLLDDAARADGAVDEPGVRTDLGTLTDHGVALQQRAGEQRDVGGQLHGGVDVRALRVEHRHAEAEPAVVRSPAQHRLGSGELAAIVDALRLVVLVRHDGDDRVAGVVQHLDHVGQVVLALVVLGVILRSAGARTLRRKQ